MRTAPGAALSRPTEDPPIAPFELTLFSFVDESGVEQSFTTTDPEVARAHAARYGLRAIRNTYEFVDSAPANLTGGATLSVDN